MRLAKPVNALTADQSNAQASFAPIEISIMAGPFPLTCEARLPSRLLASCNRLWEGQMSALEEVNGQIAALQTEDRELEREIIDIEENGMLNQSRRQTRLTNMARRQSVFEQLKALQIEQSKLHDEERKRADAAAAAIEQAMREDRSFWFRRFHTSLALAHGAGFAAVCSKLFDPALTAATAGYAFYPMGAFAIGMVLAGLIPVALYRDAGRWAWGLAGASAILFCGALIASLIAIWRQTGWPFP